MLSMHIGMYVIVTGIVFTNQIQIEWVCYNCFVACERIKSTPSVCLVLMELGSSWFGAGVLYRMEATALHFMLLSYDKFVKIIVVPVTCTLLQVSFISTLTPSLPFPHT